MRSFSVNFMDSGNVKAFFDLLTPQPFGRDRTSDGVLSNERVFRELHGHVRQEMRSQTSALLTPQLFGRDRTFDDVSSGEIVFHQLQIHGCVTG